MAGPQGRQPLLGERRRRADPRRPGPPDRLCQGHPRHHRTDGGPGGAARERAPLPAARRRRRRLRHLHARSGRHHHQLERRRRADEGLSAGRDHRPAFLALLRQGGPRRRPAGPRPRDRRARGPLRGRRLAHPQGRQPLLGLGDARRHPRRERRALGLRQDHPRHHRAPRRPGGAARERAPVPPAGARRHRLRALHARPERRRHAAGTPARERIKGYTADEIVGQHFSRFYTEHDAPAGLPRPRPPHRRRRKDASRPRAGACARTAACSGRTS